ncbi:MAG: hypothetical protein JRI56_11670 [Deltaproteobacteria bacterium]|nr:hypothetical protein [Deltaproteobacteria bacterium]
MDFLVKMDPDCSLLDLSALVADLREVMKGGGWRMKGERTRFRRLEGILELSMRWHFLI